MKLHLYLNSYRPADAERAAEVFSCLLDNARLPVIDSVFAFSEEALHPTVAAQEHVTVIPLPERLTFSRWLSEADSRSRGAIAILANADIALTDSVTRLREIFSAPGNTVPFVALSRHEETSRGPDLHPNPFWSQDVWAIGPRAEGCSPAFLHQTAFPLGTPSCDNVIAWLAHCHGYTLHNPCLQVVTLHRHRSAARSYDDQRDRLLGNACYVHPSPTIGTPSQLTFHMATRGELPVTDMRVVDIGRGRPAAHLSTASVATPVTPPTAALRFAEGGCLSLGRQVREAPRNARDTWFWQFPCRTEQVAWERHRALPAPPMRDGVADVYLGLPWATWIDRRHDPVEDAAALQVRIAGLQAELSARGCTMRLHTVCQHIHWRRLLPLWRELGVTELWLSHAPPEGSLREPMRINPWPLYAVNVETPERRDGLKRGRAATMRSITASFRGGWMPHYISLVRPRLAAQFAGRTTDGWIVETTGGWHFNDVVYAHQVAGKPLSEVDAQRAEIRRYNALLSDSVFSLCPGGAGPNTLRLWESLAVGSIPVVLSDGFRPPPVRGETDADVPPQWDEAVITHPEDALDTLEQRLAALTPEARHGMQVAGMRVYDAMRGLRCF